jgi:hypothetical protein
MVEQQLTALVDYQKTLCIAAPELLPPKSVRCSRFAGSALDSGSFRL